MNKAQLIDAVAEANELPKTKAADVLETILNIIRDALKQDDQVVLAGFGTFAPKKRAARVGRDPRTGSALQIPAAVVAGFKAGKGLKDALNGAAAK